MLLVARLTDVPAVTELEASAREDLRALEVAASALLGGAIGTLFLAPLLGMAVGAAAGAHRADSRDLGIPDDLTHQRGPAWCRAAPL